MRAKSRIAKGKRFEDMLAKDIEAMGFGDARREIGSGSGKRKGDIAANIPFLIEAKNHKRYNWWDCVDQAKEQAQTGSVYKSKWALVVRDPRTPEKRSDIYAMIDWGEFLKLMKKDKEPQIKKPDKDLVWKVRSALKSLKRVEKHLKKLTK